MEVHSEPKQDKGIRECSSIAKGKNLHCPRGTGDNPFSIWDLFEDTKKPVSGGQLEGNPLENSTESATIQAISS
jgi:hypothetical protein